MFYDFINGTRSRITITQGQIRAFNEAGDDLVLHLDDNEKIFTAYEVIAEELRKYRTKEQKEFDELVEFAIEADEEGAKQFINPWQESQEYRVGQFLVYGDEIYRVVQPHVSQADWLPDEVPALYTLANKTTTDPVDETPEWTQPTGGHDAYNKGDRVMFEGVKYESLIDANTWRPAEYPAGWIVVID